MQYYNNPYYSEGYKLKPWFVLTEEERSYIAFQSYKARVLNSDEVKGYLRSVRWSNYSNVLFPIIAFPLLRKTLFKAFSSAIYFKADGATSAALQGAIVGLSWLAWVNYSPLYTKVVNEREDLLKTVEKRIGYKMLTLNDVLPRFETCRDIHRQMQQLYNERNSFLTGYLYAPDENAEPLIDLKSIPRKNRDKIVK